MAEPERTGRQQATQFKPGQSGNPKGRPLGARNRLGGAFLEALESDFKEHGVSAIERVRNERPHEYLKVIAGILPKELSVTVEEELSDAELDRRIRQLAAAIGMQVGAGAAAGDEGEEAQGGSTQH